MQSSAGAVGIMQINPRVWRGFYDTNVLRTDTAYNARAGAEILRHYLVDYALRKKEHELGGSVDALARATYSAYNGGPGQIGRYRSEKAPKSPARDRRRVLASLPNGERQETSSAYASATAPRARLAN